mgnify:CR=1 FL=1
MRRNTVYIESVILVVALGLTACTTYTSMPQLITTDIDKSVTHCELTLRSDEWMTAFMMSPEQRSESLGLVDNPEGIEQISKRAILLTHSDATYRELREAEDLILNQLPLAGDASECDFDHMIDYILKLNQTLQKRKSEIVLLRRQINEQQKSIEAQSLENAELAKKIEALTNIEHRMKSRSKNQEPEVSP